MMLHFFILSQVTQHFNCFTSRSLDIYCDTSSTFTIASVYSDSDTLTCQRSCDPPANTYAAGDQGSFTRQCKSMGAP